MDDMAKALTRPPDYYSKGDRSTILRINKDHPYYRTSNNGSISLPRLVVAERLGRNLTKDDIVYHKDENKDNNDIDNLVVLTKREYHNIQTYARLKRNAERLDSKLSLYKQRIIDSGIDPDTLVKEDPDDRWREVDRDREAFERSRGHREEIEE